MLGDIDREGAYLQMMKKQGRENWSNRQYLKLSCIFSQLVYYIAIQYVKRIDTIQ